MKVLFYLRKKKGDRMQFLTNITAAINGQKKQISKSTILASK